MTEQESANYKLVAEAFAELIMLPMGIESWSRERMEEVASGLERIGHPKTAQHLREGYNFCLSQRVGRIT